MARKFIRIIINIFILYSFWAWLKAASVPLGMSFTILSFFSYIYKQLCNLEKGLPDTDVEEEVKQEMKYVVKELKKTK